MIRRKLLIATLSALCAFALASCLILTDALEPLEEPAVRLMGRFRPPVPPPSGLVLLPVEDNRLNLSLLLEALAKRPPRALVFVHPLASSPSDASVFDSSLAERMGLVGPVILSVHAAAGLPPDKPRDWIKPPLSLSNLSGPTLHLPEITVQSEPHRRFSNVSLVATYLEDSGSSLHYPLIYRHGTRFLASLPLAAFIVHDQTFDKLIQARISDRIEWTAPSGRREVPVDPHGRLLLNPRFQLQDFQQASLDTLIAESNRLLENPDAPTPALDALKNTLVILYPPSAASSPGLTSMVQAVANILQADYLRRTGPFATYGLGFLILWTGALIVSFLQGLPRVLAMVLVASLCAALGVLFFRHSWLWPWECILAGLLMILPWTLLFESLFMENPAPVPPSDDGETPEIPQPS